MFYPVRGSIFLILLIMIAVSTSVIYISATRVMSEEISKPNLTVEEVSPIEVTPVGKSIVANLSDMTIELRDGTTTVAVLNIISKGKPGSYYETPGGVYENDYKEPIHFSSIGHVYMPWSVHIFGNFFVHGIPYYPDGTRVSSTYSGGCIRLADVDAKKVYEFIERGTPIIVTGTDSTAFSVSPSSSEEVESMDMTRYMAATISLEFLTQDDQIFWNNIVTTRRKMLYDLLVLNDDTVSLNFATYYGKDLFIQRMNEKAKSIGLNNTVFKGVNVPAETTNEDYSRFVKYINEYKSYLLNVSTTQ